MGGGGGLLGGVTSSIFGSTDDSGTKRAGAVAESGQSAIADLEKQVQGLQGSQTQFGNLLASQALGNQTPITQAMLQQAQDRQLAQQLGAMQANRSVNPALAQRQYLQSAAQQGQQTAQQAGILGLQEQQARQGQFANYLNSLYGHQASTLGAATGAAGGFANAVGANQARQDQLNQQLLGAAGSGAAAGAGMFGGGAGGGAAGGRAMAGGAGDAMAMSPAMMLAAHGGEVPSHGPRSIVGKHFHNMKSGGHVPGQASVDGDSYKNDTVPAMLSPGEVVIPRSVMQSDDAPKKAAKFVAAVLAKKGKK